MIRTWAKRSRRFYRARHVALGLTVALATAILCAAMLAGHSLKEGLRQGLEARIGGLRSAVFFPETTVPIALTNTVPGSHGALLLRGELLNADGDVCAADVQVIGLPSLHSPRLNSRGWAAMQLGVRSEELGALLPS